MFNLPGFNTSHHLDGKFCNTTALPTNAGRAKFTDMMKFMGMSRDVVEQIERRDASHDFAGISDGVRVWWIGHATNLIQLKDTFVITDPVFADCASPVSFIAKRVTPLPCTVNDLPKIDYILISHNHYDHLCYESLVQIRERFPDVKILAPLGVTGRLKDWGFESVEFDWRQGMMFGPIEFDCFPARHGSNRKGYDNNKDLWCSWLIRYDGISIYYPGDTAISSHFEEVRAYNGKDIDLALMPIGPQEPKDVMRWVHLDPAEAWEMSQILGAKKVIPIHYGVFALGIHPEEDDIVIARRVFPESVLLELPVGGVVEWDGSQFNKQE